MIIRHYFDKNTAKITRFVFLKRKNRQIEYYYEIFINCHGYLEIYSIRKYIMKESDLFDKRYMIIYKMIHRCYRKEYEEYEECEI